MKEVILPFTPEKLERQIIELANLPTLPGVIRMIGKMTESRDTSASDVAGVIATDQVLSAKILRLVNSPVYGFPGRISSVTHAVVLLGFNVVKGLVLGTAIFDALGQQGHGFWEHSLGCAIISRRLAREHETRDVEEVMVAGLLHDLGKVALAYLSWRDYERAVNIAKTSRCHIADAERVVFSVDHTRVNRWLADEWHFPARLAEPLKFHHAIESAKEYRDVTAIVHVADILARSMGYGFPGDVSMPTLSHEGFQCLGLSFEQIDKALEDAEVEYSASVDIFTVGE